MKRESEMSAGWAGPPMATDHDTHAARPSLSAREARCGAARALLGVGILVHLLFLVSLRTGWLNPLFNDAMHRFGPGCDFFSIYAAGIKARAGQPVYTVWDHVEAAPYAYAFRYAPLVAYTLGLGLSLLPALGAYGLWLIACELALLRNVRLTVERAPDRRTGYVAAAMWLLFSPYYLELYVGQFTFLTASLVFWAYLAWDEGERGQRSGDLWFAGAVWLKLMPLVYLPIALVRGRGKGLVGTVAVLVGSSAAYFAIFPADWAVFRDTNLDPRPSWHAGNQGLMALLYGLCGERVSVYLASRAAFTVLVGFLVVWLALRAWRAGRSEGAMLALYAGATAAYLLVYKDVWEHHYLLLLPPLVMLRLRREPPWLWLPAFVVCALPSLFALCDVSGLGYNEDPQRYWQPAVSLLHHGWKPLGPLWLLAGLAMQAAGPSAFARAFGAPGARAAPAIRAIAGLVIVPGMLVGLVVGVRWAHAALVRQDRLTRALTWPEEVFRKQERPETCGPAALAAVCRHYGVAATEAEIASLAGTTSEGTSMLGLEEAAWRKGLVAAAWRVTVGELGRLPRPCLLFFHPGHFAILTGVQGESFYLADPTVGQRVCTKELLGEVWSGEVLVVGPSTH